MAGLMIVELANQFFPHNYPKKCLENDAEPSKLLGYIMVFGSTAFVAMQYTIEEQITKNYYVHPLKVVGWEGLFGSLLYMIVLILLQFVRCPKPPTGKSTWVNLMCTQNDIGEWRLEDTLFALRAFS